MDILFGVSNHRYVLIGMRNTSTRKRANGVKQNSNGLCTLIWATLWFWIHHRTIILSPYLYTQPVVLQGVAYSPGSLDMVGFFGTPVFFMYHTYMYMFLLIG